ncbi:MAG: tRNA pseudouridine(13) synthase TruD [Candidatus Micrarchaeia archaeon]
MDFNFLTHLSKKKGCGGKRIEEPEGFIVEEIFNGKNVRELNLKEEKETEYITFVLKKKNYTTYEALKILSERLQIEIDRFSVAGQKDKNAITYQLVSCWKGKDITPQKLLSVIKSEENIEIIKVWNTDYKIKVGELTGNSFTVRIKDVENIDNINEIMEDNKDKIPNYFGPQRFGTRSTNVKVARYLLLKNYEAAIKNLLQIPENENINDIDNMNNFGLYEKKIVRFLKDKTDPKDFMSALKIIPNSILRLILESYQSYLFNLELSYRIKNSLLEPMENDKTCGFNKYGFIDVNMPGNEVVCTQLVGYDSKPNNIIKDILWEEGIEIGDFKLRELSNVSLKGSWRPLLVNVKDLNIKKDKDEYELKFKLTKGAYATSALREFMDIKRI